MITRQNIVRLNVDLELKTEEEDIDKLIDNKLEDLRTIILKDAEIKDVSRRLRTILEEIPKFRIETDLFEIGIAKRIIDLWIPARLPSPKPPKISFDKEFIAKASSTFNIISGLILGLIKDAVIGMNMKGIMFTRIEDISVDFSRIVDDKIVTKIKELGTAPSFKEITVNIDKENKSYAFVYRFEEEEEEKGLLILAEFEFKNIDEILDLNEVIDTVLNRLNDIDRIIR